MTGTDLCVNNPHCAAAVRPWESEATTSTLPPARVKNLFSPVWELLEWWAIMVTKKKISPGHIWTTLYLRGTDPWASKLYVLSCVLIRCVYICKSNYFDILCTISFKEHLLEDGHNRWPKQVGGYAIYNTVNLRVCICTYWSISRNESSVNGHESLKFVTGLGLSARFFRFPLLTTILPLLQHIRPYLTNYAMAWSSLSLCWRGWGSFSSSILMVTE